MKRKLFLLCFFQLLNISFIYSQQITFQKLYPSNNPVFVSFEIIQTADKGYLTGNAAALLKIDSLGNKEWMKQILQSFFCIDKTSDGGYITAGYRLIKFDGNYFLSWAMDLAGISSYTIYTVRETSDHGFIMGGDIYYASSSDYRFLLVKTDSSGIVQWSKVYDMPGDQTFSFLSPSPDGGFVLCGAQDDLPYFKIALLKVDSAGNSQWAKNYTSPNSTSFTNHITNTSDNGYVMVGYRNHYIFLLKVDLSGNIVWEKLYSSPFNCTARWVEETKDKGLIVAGNIDGVDSGFVAQTGLLMKTDSLGNFEWANQLGGFTDVWGCCARQTEDNGYVFACRKSDPIGIMKTDSLGHTNGCYESPPPPITVTNLNDTTIIVPVTDSIINVTSVPLVLTDSLVGSEITFCAPVGVEEIQKVKAAIEIYPNPNYGNFSVSSLHLIQNIGISDLSGRLIFSKEKIFSNFYECKLNAPDGIYIAEVFCNGNVYRRKIAVTH